MNGRPLLLAGGLLLLPVLAGCESQPMFPDGILPARILADPQAGVILAGVALAVAYLVGGARPSAPASRLGRTTD